MGHGLISKQVKQKQNKQKEPVQVVLGQWHLFCPLARELAGAEWLGTCSLENEHQKEMAL